MKKFGANEVAFYKTLTLPLVAVINLLWFFENFNSVSVKNPVKMAFDDLYAEFNNIENYDNPLKSNLAYKLFNLALTLAGKRINNVKPMESLVFDTKLLQDPLYATLLDFGTSFATNKDLTDLKELAFQPKYLGPGFSKGTHMSSSVRGFLKLPVGRLRFSKYDRIRPDRLVHIYTEGKTDAQIIEYAFTVLTGKVPYWSIQPVGVDENSGGANELTNALMNGHNFLREEETIIGIYDNDAKGCQEFGGLKLSRFELYQGSSRVKKHKTSQIFAIKLPVPPDKQNFIQEDQVYNVFSIEHYFSEDFLREKGVVEESPIVGTFKIKESKKTEFAKAVVQISDKSIFLEFIHLFRVIDELANRADIEYDIA